MRVAKWGNSLAVRLPASLVEELDLKEGDEVEVKSANQDGLEIARKLSRKELVERLHKYHGLISGDIQFDREEANAR